MSESRSENPLRQPRLSTKSSFTPKASDTNSSGLSVQLESKYQNADFNTLVTKNVNQNSESGYLKRNRSESRPRTVAQNESVNRGRAEDARGWDGERAERYIHRRARSSLDGVSTRSYNDRRASAEFGRGFIMDAVIQRGLDKAQNFVRLSNEIEQSLARGELGGARRPSTLNTLISGDIPQSMEYSRDRSNTECSNISVVHKPRTQSEPPVRRHAHVHEGLINQVNNENFEHKQEWMSPGVRPFESVRPSSAENSPRKKKKRAKKEATSMTSQRPKMHAGEETHKVVLTSSCTSQNAGAKETNSLTKQLLEGSVMNSDTTVRTPPPSYKVHTPRMTSSDAKRNDAPPTDAKDSSPNPNLVCKVGDTKKRFREWQPCPSQTPPKLEVDVLKPPTENESPKKKQRSETNLHQESEKKPKTKLKTPPKALTSPKQEVQSSKTETQSPKGMTQSPKGVTQSPKGVTQFSKGLTQPPKGVTQPSTSVTQSTKIETKTPKDSSKPSKADSKPPPADTQEEAQSQPSPCKPQHKSRISCKKRSPRETKSSSPVHDYDQGQSPRMKGDKKCKLKYSPCNKKDKKRNPCGWGPGGNRGIAFCRKNFFGNIAQAVGDQLSCIAFRNSLFNSFPGMMGLYRPDIGMDSLFANYSDDDGDEAKTCRTADDGEDTSDQFSTQEKLDSEKEDVRGRRKSSSSVPPTGSKRPSYYSPPLEVNKKEKTAPTSQRKLQASVEYVEPASPVPTEYLDDELLTRKELTQDIAYTSAPSSRRDSIHVSEKVGHISRRESLHIQEATGTPSRRESLHIQEATGIPSRRESLHIQETTGTPSRRESLHIQEATGIPSRRESLHIEETIGIPSRRDSLHFEEIEGSHSQRESRHIPEIPFSSSRKDIMLTSTTTVFPSRRDIPEISHAASPAPIRESLHISDTALPGTRGESLHIETAVHDRRESFVDVSLESTQPSTPAIGQPESPISPTETPAPYPLSRKSSGKSLQEAILVPEEMTIEIDRVPVQVPSIRKSIVESKRHSVEKKSYDSRTESQFVDSISICSTPQSQKSLPLRKPNVCEDYDRRASHRRMSEICAQCCDYDKKYPRDDICDKYLQRGQEQQVYDPCQRFEQSDLKQSKTQSSRLKTYLEMDKDVIAQVTPPRETDAMRKYSTPTESRFPSRVSFAEHSTQENQQKQNVDHIYDGRSNVIVGRKSHSSRGECAKGSDTLPQADLEQFVIVPQTDHGRFRENESQILIHSESTVASIEGRKSSGPSVRRRSSQSQDQRPSKGSKILSGGSSTKYVRSGGTYSTGKCASESSSVCSGIEEEKGKRPRPSTRASRHHSIREEANIVVVTPTNYISQLKHETCISDCSDPNNPSLDCFDTLVTTVSPQKKQFFEKKSDDSVSRGKPFDDHYKEYCEKMRLLQLRSSSAGRDWDVEDDAQSIGCDSLLVSSSLKRNSSRKTSESRKSDCRRESESPTKSSRNGSRMSRISYQNDSKAPTCEERQTINSYETSSWKASRMDNHFSRPHSPLQVNDTKHESGNDDASYSDKSDSPTLDEPPSLDTDDNKLESPIFVPDKDSSKPSSSSSYPDNDVASNQSRGSMRFQELYKTNESSPEHRDSLDTTPEKFKDTSRYLQVHSRKESKQRRSHDYKRREGDTSDLQSDSDISKSECENDDDICRNSPSGDMCSPAHIRKIRGRITFRRTEDSKNCPSSKSTAVSIQNGTVKMITSPKGIKIVKCCPEEGDTSLSSDCSTLHESSCHAIPVSNNSSKTLPTRSSGRRVDENMQKYMRDSQYIKDRQRRLQELEQDNTHSCSQTRDHTPRHHSPVPAPRAGKSKHRNYSISYSRKAEGLANSEESGASKISLRSRSNSSRSRLESRPIDKFSQVITPEQPTYTRNQQKPSSESSGQLSEKVDSIGIPQVIPSSKNHRSKESPAKMALRLNTHADTDESSGSGFSSPRKNPFLFVPSQFIPNDDSESMDASNNKCKQRSGSSRSTCPQKLSADSHCAQVPRKRRQTHVDPSNSPGHFVPEEDYLDIASSASDPAALSKNKNCSSNAERDRNSSSGGDLLYPDFAYHCGVVDTLRLLDMDNVSSSASSHLSTTEGNCDNYSLRRIFNLRSMCHLENEEFNEFVKSLPSMSVNNDDDEAFEQIRQNSIKALLFAASLSNNYSPLLLFSNETSRDTARWIQEIKERRETEKNKASVTSQSVESPPMDMNHNIALPNNQTATHHSNKVFHNSVNIAGHSNVPPHQSCTVASLSVTEENSSNVQLNQSPNKELSQPHDFDRFSSLCKLCSSRSVGVDTSVPPQPKPITRGVKVQVASSRNAAIQTQNDARKTPKSDKGENTEQQYFTQDFEASTNLDSPVCCKTCRKPRTEVKANKPKVSCVRSVSRELNKHSDTKLESNQKCSALSSNRNMKDIMHYLSRPLSLGSLTRRGMKRMRSQSPNLKLRARIRSAERRRAKTGRSMSAESLSVCAGDRRDSSCDREICQISFGHRPRSRSVKHRGTKTRLCRKHSPDDRHVRCGCNDDEANEGQTTIKQANSSSNVGAIARDSFAVHKKTRGCAANAHLSSHEQLLNACACSRCQLKTQDKRKTTKDCQCACRAHRAKNGKKDCFEDSHNKTRNNSENCYDDEATYLDNVTVLVVASASSASEENGANRISPRQVRCENTKKKKYRKKMLKKALKHEALANSEGSNDELHVLDHLNKTCNKSSSYTENQEHRFLWNNITNDESDNVQYLLQPEMDCLSDDMTYTSSLCEDFISGYNLGKQKTVNGKLGQASRHLAEFQENSNLHPKRKEKFISTAKQNRSNSSKWNTGDLRFGSSDSLTHSVEDNISESPDLTSQVTDASSIFLRYQEMIGRVRSCDQCSAASDCTPKVPTIQDMANALRNAAMLNSKYSSDQEMDVSENISLEEIRSSSVDGYSYLNGWYASKEDGECMTPVDEEPSKQDLSMDQEIKREDCRIKKGRDTSVEKEAESEQKPTSLKFLQSILDSQVKVLFDKAIKKWTSPVRQKFEQMEKGNAIPQELDLPTKGSELIDLTVDRDDKPTALVKEAPPKLETPKEMSASQIDACQVTVEPSHPTADIQPQEPGGDEATNMVKSGSKKKSESKVKPASPESKQKKQSTQESKKSARAMKGANADTDKHGGKSRSPSKTKSETAEITNKSTSGQPSQKKRSPSPKRRRLSTAASEPHRPSNRARSPIVNTESRKSPALKNIAGSAEIGQSFPSPKGQHKHSSSTSKHKKLKSKMKKSPAHSHVDESINLSNRSQIFNACGISRIASNLKVLPAPAHSLSSSSSITEDLKQKILTSCKNFKHDIMYRKMMEELMEHKLASQPEKIDVFDMEPESLAECDAFDSCLLTPILEESHTPYDRSKSDFNAFVNECKSKLKEISYDRDKTLSDKSLSNISTKLSGSSTASEARGKSDTNKLDSIDHNLSAVPSKPVGRFTNVDVHSTLEDKCGSGSEEMPALHLKIPFKSAFLRNELSTFHSEDQVNAPLTKEELLISRYSSRKTDYRYHVGEDLVSDNTSENTNFSKTVTRYSEPGEISRAPILRKHFHSYGTYPKLNYNYTDSTYKSSYLKASATEFIDSYTSSRLFGRARFNSVPTEYQWIPPSSEDLGKAHGDLVTRNWNESANNGYDSSSSDNSSGNGDLGMEEEEEDEHDDLAGRNGVRVTGYHGKLLASTIVDKKCEDAKSFQAANDHFKRRGKQQACDEQCCVSHDQTCNPYELLKPHTQSNLLSNFATRNINGSGNLFGRVGRQTDEHRKNNHRPTDAQMADSDEDFTSASEEMSQFSSVKLRAKFIRNEVQEMDDTCNHPDPMSYYGAGGPNSQFDVFNGAPKEDLLMNLYPSNDEHATVISSYRQKCNAEKLQETLERQATSENKASCSERELHQQQIDKVPFCGQRNCFGQGDTSSKKAFTQWYFEDGEKNRLLQRRAPDATKFVHREAWSEAPDATKFVHREAWSEALQNDSKSGECVEDEGDDDDEDEDDEDEEEDEEEEVEEDEEEIYEEEEGDSEESNDEADSKEHLVDDAPCGEAKVSDKTGLDGPPMSGDQDMQRDSKNNIDAGDQRKICTNVAHKIKGPGSKTLRSSGKNSGHHRCNNAHKAGYHKFSLDQIKVPAIEKERVRFACDENGDWAEIGRGSYGCVYLGLLDGIIEVAIKDFYESSSWDLVIHEARMLMFLQETGITPKFYGLRRRFDVSKQPSEYCIIMEYFGDGRTLFNVLSDKIALTRDEWLDIVGQLVAGLRLIHRKNILINDLKADNILIDLTGGRKIIRYIDVGMATYKQGLTFQLPQDQMSKYNFLAPEVREGARTTTRSDIYSLGYMLEQMSRLADSALGGLKKLIVRCTDKNPARRPDIDDIVSQVHRFIASKACAPVVPANSQEQFLLTNSV